MVLRRGCDHPHIETIHKVCDIVYLRHTTDT